MGVRGAADEAADAEDKELVRHSHGDGGVGRAGVAVLAASILHAAMPRYIRDGLIAGPVRCVCDGFGFAVRRRCFFSGVGRVCKR